MIITIILADLRQDLGTGDLRSGDKLSAGKVRRPAGTAHLLPAVLGGKPEVLDLGRA